MSRGGTLVPPRALLQRNDAMLGGPAARPAKPASGPGDPTDVARGLTSSGRIRTLHDEHTFVDLDQEGFPVSAETTLTARQQEIWQFLVTYVDGHGYPPTVREIGEEVGLASPSTVHAHLANLERVGLIRRDPTKPRAIELTGHRRVVEPAAEAVPRLPLLGRVAAGGPLLAEENVEDVIAVPEPLGRGADFLLTVHGDSMIEAGILDGDTLVVQSRDEARNGDVVVALAGEDESADEATVKTFYREADGRVRLQPENAALEPIYADHVKILGKVVGVFRSL
jgi:repressor LexA